MTQKKQVPLKPAPSRSGELPDAALDKVAGGGYTGAQAGDPVEGPREYQETKSR